MKHFIPTLLLLLLMAACSGGVKQQEPETPAAEAVDPAAEALSRVERLLADGQYRDCCEAIKQLRKDFPEAIEARKRCIGLWDKAQLGIAREELEKAETLLAEAERKIKTARTREAKYLLENEMDEQRDRRDAQREIVKMLEEKLGIGTDVGQESAIAPEE